MNDEKIIYVYADFLPYHNELIGKLYASGTKGREFYSFEYDTGWLSHEGTFLDPDLQFYKGRQYINDDKNIFGLFADSCPDRWGRLLMKRREAIRAKKAGEKPGKKDGAGAVDGSSYLDIVSFLKANGATPKKDLIELWKRIVFSMAVSNTDDHFRNHGFILSQEGWILSPLYDVNPDIYGDNLSLNVNADDSSIDFDLAVESAIYYGVDEDQAIRSVENIKQTVRDNWRNIARKYGISRGEMEKMEPAFRACE